MSEWTSARLGELACRLTYRNARGNDNVLTISAQHGLVSQERYFNKRVASKNLSNYFLLERGDFAYNKSYSNGYPLGAIKRLEQHDTGVVSPLYICFRVNDANRVESTYLVYFFESGAFNEHLRSIAREGARNHGLLNVKPAEFFDLPVTLPPLPEQRKIAAILTAVDETIEKTEAVIEQLGVVKKAMMQELLTRGLPGRHTRFKQTEIGEVPEKWEVLPCGEVFDVQLGKMISAKTRAGANQLPYLRNQNVYWDRFELDDVALMHFDSRERDKFRLKKGDLLACEGRHIGRCAVWRDELDECYYQKALHRLRPRSDRVTTEYMQRYMTLRFLYSDDLVSQVRTSTTIPHLPREQLLRLAVVLPSRAEQEEILDAVGSVRRRELAEEAWLSELAATKSALMSVLLTGALRVTPDEDAA